MWVKCCGEDFYLFYNLFIINFVFLETAALVKSRLRVRIRNWPICGGVFVWVYRVEGIWIGIRTLLHQFLHCTGWGCCSSLRFGWIEIKICKSRGESSGFGSFLQSGVSAVPPCHKGLSCSCSHSHERGSWQNFKEVFCFFGIIIAIQVVECALDIKLISVMISLVWLLVHTTSLSSHWQPSLKLIVPTLIVLLTGVDIPEGLKNAWCIFAMKKESQSHSNVDLGWWQEYWAGVGCAVMQSSNTEVANAFFYSQLHF